MLDLQSLVHAFVDLDDTMFQTKAKCRSQIGLEPASYLKDGQVSGYTTPQQRVLARLLGNTVVIPVTARDHATMLRSEIGRACSGGRSVFANGGAVHGPDGVLDLEWETRLDNASRDALSVSEAYAKAQRKLVPDCVDTRHWIVRHRARDLYIVFKSNLPSDDDRLHSLGHIMLAEIREGWTLHANGNNVALIPPWLGKRQAVAHVIEQIRAEDPDAPFIGFGDSTSDAGFILECDYAMLPSNSQIGALLRNAAI